MSRDRSWNDGDKLSFSERDRRRREGGSRDEKRPHGVSKLQHEKAEKQYLKKLDRLFSKPGADAQKHAAAVRAAHGSKELPDACRAYRDAVGWPSDCVLIGIFLDTGDSALVAGVLESFLASCAPGETLETTAGLRSQLRMLVNGRDSLIAGLAEDLLAAL